MTRFSVIVPVYNIEQYISQCITSILEQSLGDFELIIIDDGSTDGSGKICDIFAASDNRVRVLHKENGGLSDARNEGLMNAKGDYVVFIDGDDFIEPGSLEAISQKLEKTMNPDVLVTKIRQFFEDGAIRYMDKEMPIELLNEGKKEDYIKWLFGRSDNTWPAVRYLVKHDLILKHNLQFLKGYLHEDIDWTSHLFLFSESYACLDSYWYNHRKGRPGSITAGHSAKGINDVIKIAASNIRDSHYKALPSDQRNVIFERLVKSVLYKLKDYRNLERNESEVILQAIEDNIEIFRLASSLKHRAFVSFCNIFGFRAGLFLLSTFFEEK